VVGIALDWPIETAGKRGLRVERAQIEEARSILALRRAAWGAHSRVRAALSGRELALRERAAAGALLDLEEAHAASLRRAIDAGEIPRGALLTLEVEIARSRARTLEAEARASVALADLAAALAVPRSALDGAALAPFDLGAGPAEFDPDEQRRAALSGRSDLAAALLDFQVADVEVRTEVARQYPDLRLGPGYTWDQGAHKIALGLAFEVPLLHGQGAAIAEASARRERAAAAFEAAQVRAFGEIERARVGWDAARASAAAQDEVLLRARERERAAGSRLAAGAAGRAELSEAAIARAQAELDALDGARRVEEARRALEDALEHPLGEPLWTPLGAQVARGGTR
jgi:outer membrane protein TolC